ncbi:MAG: tetratricopeptide repeat protein [Acidobacteriota bacterium]|nr:tetratricopeptide repeat protein [Acidobacteriota bacterium]
MRQGWSALNELIRTDYSWSGYERNLFYANNRDGTFSDLSGAVGLDFVEDGRAFVLADFDRDGRLEVLLKNRNGPQLRLLKNVLQDLPSSISFRLRGVKSNRDAIGAAITIETNLGRQRRMLQGGSGFLSQHSKEVFFGLGEVKGQVRASIRWPSGLVQSIDGLPPDHRILVEEGAESFRVEPFRSAIFSTPQPQPQLSESFPRTIETWLLAPVSAPGFSLAATDGVRRTLSSFRGTCVLLYFLTMQSKDCQDDLVTFERFHQRWATQGLHLLTVSLDEANDPESVRMLERERDFTFPVLLAAGDTAAIYNILYRSLFDRHRDLSLPTSLLINGEGEIVKIYQGPLNPDHVIEDFREIPSSIRERLAKALPFVAPDGATFAFGRNYLSLGSLYFQRGYFDQAEASFRLALREDGASAEAYYGLGSAYLKKSNIAEARAAFEQAVKLNSSYPDTKPNAWNNLGLIATQEGRTDAAIDFFQRALELNPDYVIALENLGSAYRQQKRWDEAQRALQHALEVAPDDPEANYSLGMVLAQTDQPDRAYTYLRKALQLRPAYPEAMNNLGVLYLKTRRRDEAVAEFETCIRIAPAFDQSYLNLARVYAIEGDRDKARETLLALLKQQPNHAQAQTALKELQ